MNYPTTNNELSDEQAEFQESRDTQDHSSTQNHHV